MFKRSIALLGLMVLSVVGLKLLAAPPLTDFNFTFDTKDDLAGWQANDPTKAQWQAGGVGNSAGCLKLSGGFCSADSPFLHFTALDNAISFDYYVHGDTTFRMRVSVLSEEARAKYGTYANLLIRHPEQDKWVHKEVKLVDLPGVENDNTAQATPEIQYRKLSFCTIDVAPTDSYLLIDNVKLVKAAVATTHPAK